MYTNQEYPETKPCKRPCKVITLQEKYAILKQLEGGSSRREVELMFKCSQSTISRVLAGKESIMKEAEGIVPSKRDKLMGYKILDTALSRWAWDMKSSNALITASLAKQKAAELSLAIGLELKPSIAWLYKWKERKNIRFAKFFNKNEKYKEMPTINEENAKKIILDNVERKTDNAIVRENKGSQSQQDNTGDVGNKIRTKRHYIKRLPIIDADGVICRSRKEKTFLTLLQKLEVLQRLKNGERRQDLITEYKLSQSAMSLIVTDEEKILKLAADGQNLQLKRIRGGIFKAGEAELNAWVGQKMENGESLTRTEIKKRAKEIASRLNIKFKASAGWLEKWKSRMNLDFNEYQILKRKVPNYMANDEESENTHTLIEPYGTPRARHVHKVLRKQMENYCDDMETHDEFSYTDIDEPDVKPEIKTPQQIYLPTVQPDSQASKSCNDPHTDQRSVETLKSEDELDIKPFMGTPPHIVESREATKQADTLHEQIFSWLSRYNIDSVAASALLNILQPHLCSDAN